MPTYSLSEGNEAMDVVFSWFHLVLFYDAANSKPGSWGQEEDQWYGSPTSL